MKDKNKTRANKQKQRRCISSGEVCDKSDMIRFIVGLNNEVIPDSPKETKELVEIKES